MKPDTVVGEVKPEPALIRFGCLDWEIQALIELGEKSQKEIAELKKRWEELKACIGDMDTDMPLNWITEKMAELEGKG